MSSAPAASPNGDGNGRGGVGGQEEKGDCWLGLLRDCLTLEERPRLAAHLEHLKHDAERSARAAATLRAETRALVLLRGAAAAAAAVISRAAIIPGAASWVAASCCGAVRQCTRDPLDVTRAEGLSLALTLIHDEPCSARQLNGDNLLVEVCQQLLGDRGECEAALGVRQAALEQAMAAVAAGRARRLSLLVVRGRVQDAEHKLALATSSAAVKASALQVVEALLQDRPRAAAAGHTRPTADLVRVLCLLLVRLMPGAEAAARADAQLVVRGAALLTRLVRAAEEWAEVDVTPCGAVALPQMVRFGLCNSSCRVHSSSTHTSICLQSLSPVWEDAGVTTVAVGAAEATSGRVGVDVFHHGFHGMELIGTAFISLPPLFAEASRREALAGKWLGGGYTEVTVGDTHAGEYFALCRQMAGLGDTAQAELEGETKGVTGSKAGHKAAERRHGTVSSGGARDRRDAAAHGLCGRDGAGYGVIPDAGWVAVHGLRSPARKGGLASFDGDGHPEGMHKHRSLLRLRVRYWPPIPARSCIHLGRDSSTHGARCFDTSEYWPPIPACSRRHLGHPTCRTGGRDSSMHGARCLSLAKLRACVSGTACCCKPRPSWSNKASSHNSSSTPSRGLPETAAGVCTRASR